MSRLKAAFIQTSPIFGDIERNTADAVRRIAAVNAGLVVLPELFSTGYQFKTRKEALSLADDAESGYASRALRETAKEKGIFICAGIAERHRGAVYNSAILMGPKGLVGVYRKAHLFWNEKKIFSKGYTRFKVYDLGTARVGIMICFDWLFPEAMRTLSLEGADVVCHPSNLVMPYCPDAMVTRCLENRVFAITANRVGKEGRIKGERLNFIGTSQITAPDGRILARAGRSMPESVTIEIDVKAGRSKRITPLNDIFKDRRTDLYKL